MSMGGRSFIEPREGANGREERGYPPCYLFCSEKKKKRKVFMLLYHECLRADELMGGRGFH